MTNLFWLVICFYVIFGLVVPAIIVWLVIRYIFLLRARQNDMFLDDLGHVVHDAVLDALKDNESAKRYTKTVQTNYTQKK